MTCCEPFFNFGLYRRKTAPKWSKICNCSKLAWYSPENGNAWTKCLIGGVSRGFWESARRFGRSKSLFMSLEKGHFRQFSNHDFQKGCRRKELGVFGNTLVYSVVTIMPCLHQWRDTWNAQSYGFKKITLGPSHRWDNIGYHWHIGEKEYKR